MNAPGPYFEPSPLEARPVLSADVPFFNQLYLHTCGPDGDPTMVWGSEVDMTDVRQRLSTLNRESPVLLTPAHLLVKAVADALDLHPEFNARVLGSQLYRFNEINVLVPVQRGARGLSVCLLRNVDRMSCAEIGSALWTEQKAAQATLGADTAESTFRRLPGPLARTLLRTLVWLANHVNKPMGPFDRHLRAAPVLVNYLGFPGAPPLLAYKPSRAPSNCTTMNVTLGPASWRPAVIDGEVLPRQMATLIVRADHRLADACQLSTFVQTVRTRLTQSDEPGSNGQAVGHKRGQVVRV